MIHDTALVGHGQPEAPDTALTIAVTEAKAAIDAVRSIRGLSPADRLKLLAHARNAILRLPGTPGAVSAALASLTGGAA